VDSYVRRTTKTFSFLWSFVALVLVTIGILVGAVTESTPDWFVVAFPAVSAFGAAVIGFMHGVTLSAARNLDDQTESDDTDTAMTTPYPR
jgi:hypothetical protein